MTRAIAKRIRTKAIRTDAAPKPRAIIVGSGDLTKLKTARGRETIGPLVGSALRAAVKPAVSSTGEVSPMPRAVPRMTAVARPERAVGRTTCHTVRQRGAPRASAASVRLPGTRRRTTSDARITIGSIITLIANPAARPDLGMPRPRIQTAYTIRPATID